jgi:hypothetical protein
VIFFVWKGWNVYGCGAEKISSLKRLLKKRLSIELRAVKKDNLNPLHKAWLGWGSLPLSKFLDRSNTSGFIEGLCFVTVSIPC